MQGFFHDLYDSDVYFVSSGIPNGKVFVFYFVGGMEKFVCFIKINFLGMRPYIYDVHKEQVGVGGGDLEICNVFAESFVFKRFKTFFVFHLFWT